MRIQLIFPPQWIPYMPYLSLPALTAYLEARGIDCRQCDLNLESYDRMLSADYLEDCGTALLHRIDEIESRDHISPELQATYEQLTAAAIRQPQVLERIAEAKGVLRGPEDFYRLERHRWAYSLLKSAFAAISLAHFPSKLSFWSFATRFNQLSVAGLRAAADCREENPYLDLFENEFIPQLLRDQPALVGLSVVSDTQLAPAFTMIRALRRRSPGLFIVVGGPLFSKLESMLYEHPELFDDVSAFVLRDGEEPLYRLCRALEAGQGLASVPNLVYRDEGGSVCTTDERVSNRIADLPTPSFDGLPIDSYFSGEPVLPLLTSHGCYWNKCRFCGSYHVYGHRFRMHRADRVLEDMKTLHRRYNCRHFHFSDEALPPAMAASIATAISSEKLPFRWFGEARLEKSFDEEACVALARGGCVKMKFGLESGSSKVLELMNKGTDLDVARGVIAACFRAGIAMHFFCMVGFPGESAQDFEATRRFFLDQSEVVHSPGFSFYCSVFSPELGSDAVVNPKALGIEEVRPVAGEELNVTLEFSAPGLPSADELEQRRWNLIRMVGQMIGTPRTPNEEVPGFLYLSHYRGNPPPVAATVKPRPVAGPLPPSARPTLASGLITRRVRLYQPVDPGNSDGEPQMASSSHGWIASTSADLRVRALHPEAMDIIGLCDGRRSLEEIVRHESPAFRRHRRSIIEDLLISGLLELDGMPALEEQ